MARDATAPDDITVPAAGIRQLGEEARRGQVPYGDDAVIIATR